MTLKTPEFTLRTNLDSDSASPFFTFLACGVLTAIQKGVVPVETGIWTLGRPQFWEALENYHAVPPALSEILQQADEWDALNLLNPVAFEKLVVDQIDRLEAELEKSGVPAWWNTIERR